jgi:hypothetical protein
MGCTYSMAGSAQERRKIIADKQKGRSQAALCSISSG